MTETETAGHSSLTYDAASGRYHYVWKTDKAWAGTCRRLVLGLDDSSDHAGRVPVPVIARAGSDG